MCRMEKKYDARNRSTLRRGWLLACCTSCLIDVALFSPLDLTTLRPWRTWAAWPSSSRSVSAGVRVDLQSPFLPFGPAVGLSLLSFSSFPLSFFLPFPHRITVDLLDFQHQYLLTIAERAHPTFLSEFAYINRSLSRDS